MKKWIGLLAIAVALPMSAKAQQAAPQVITLQQETIKGDVVIPTGRTKQRQTPQFPVSSIELKPKELLARVPRSLITVEKIERVPVNSLDVNLRKKVAK